MVGLSDIPCVGKFVDRISDATVEAFFRGLRYLFCYKELVSVLNSEIEKVNIQDYRVSTKSVKERSDGKIIEDHVLRWQTEAKEMQESAKEFSEKYKNRASWTCLKCMPIPNPVSRFQLGRDAALKAKRATELVGSGEELLAHEIAHFPPSENLPKTDAAFQDFPSRKDVYGKLWEGLITEGSSLIHGIYGMPGVGKTRMVEQIWKEALEKKIFNKVVRADVGSEKLDVIKIQNQIAGYLDCHFVSQDNVESRASQLKISLMNGGKILIILDDVWREIPLDDIIGTSFGASSSSKGSKILLTSRSKDVCLHNKCKHPVQITMLSDEEAWDLFRDTVGTSHIDSLQDETLAKEVSARCAGLPLLICAVGKALQFMTYHVWKDALLKLEKGKIAGIDDQVYACVKLSIDRLQEDAKLCLFLCSLFPEDADIDLRKLIQFTIGTQLIPDGESTIPSLVEILTKSSLLLDCDKNHKTKLHDIIRDVARSIAVTDPKYAFLHIRCGSWLPENAGYSTAKLLRLDVEVNDVYFREDLVCTDLNTLWLQCNNHLQQFSSGFFCMFLNLKFLMLQNVHFSSKYFSLQPLGKLKMIIFDSCDMRETDVTLFPKNLKNLCIWDCNLPSPLDLPNLEYLQKLDITQRLEVIMVPNAISSLSNLEELHIPFGFSFSDNAKGIMPILDEISKITRLISLKILFRNFEACQGTSILFKLPRYDISVGNRLNTEALPNSTRMIELIDVKVKRDEALLSLVERAEKVRLLSTDVDVSSICNSNREACTDLRYLEIRSCDTMEFIARISQDVIQHSRESRTSFSKLTILNIGHCSAMKYLFCKSVAKCLVQLQELKIHDCGAMEVIVMNEGTIDGEIINFPKLKTLGLSSLGSLASFYREKKEKHWGSTAISLFDGMVAFPSLEELFISSLDVSEIWRKHYSDSSSFRKLKDLDVVECSKLESVIPVGMLHRPRNLECLNIVSCGRLRNAFPPCIARDLIHLRKLCIAICGMMTEIIGGDDEQKEEITDDDIIVFPELMVLTLETLDNLTSFWAFQGEESNTCKVELPCLVNCFLNHCGEIDLEAIQFGRDDSTWPLQYLYIFSDKQMQLPCKWKLHLYNLESLILYRCWWHELKSLSFPKLKSMSVRFWGGSALFTVSGFKSLQQLRELRIRSCDLLEEIVEDVRVDEDAEMDTETIKFLQLDSVYFNDLPKLKSFMNGANYKCYMPALRVVEVDNCGLSSLFISGNLQQLVLLQVENCSLLKDIVEDGRGEIINLSKLKTLELGNLGRLRSFYRENREMNLGSMDNPVISCVQSKPLFDGMVAFPSLEKLTIWNLEVGVIWGNHYSDSFSFCKLKYLQVRDCSKVESVIPVGMLYRLSNLESLDIKECRSLRNAFPLPIARDLVRLEHLSIQNCGMMTEVIGGGEEDDDHRDSIVFPELKKLELVDLKNLTHFCCHRSPGSNTFTYYKVHFRA